MPAQIEPPKPTPRYDPTAGAVIPPRGRGRLYLGILIVLAVAAGAYYWHVRSTAADAAANVGAAAPGAPGATAARAGGARGPFEPSRSPRYFRRAGGTARGAGVTWPRLP